eukprot:gene8708-biopygen14925
MFSTTVTSKTVQKELAKIPPGDLINRMSMNINTNQIKKTSTLEEQDAITKLVQIIETATKQKDDFDKATRDFYTVYDKLKIAIIEARPRGLSDDNDETRDFERVHIGFMPIMIHSKACSLRGLNPHQLRARGECPYDMGGYFVIDGREKVIVTQEERVPNRLYTRRGEKIEYDNLILKAFIRCVSTDARDVFPRTSVFRVMTSGEITATVTHINEGAVPVTTLFRALGIESDRAILKTIFHEDPGEERNKVEIEFMHASIAAGPQVRRRTFEAKAIALGEVVRHLVRAALGKEPMSELDHYANKRLMCSGAITANLFRDAYLLSIATTLRTLNEEFLTGPWRVANDIHTLVNEANLKNIFQPRIIREALDSLAYTGSRASARGSSQGARMNADTFGGEDIGAALTQLGLRENGHGNMLMHNGRSGEEAKTRIFVGVNYYGRLKHMVEDKYQSRARGAVDATTRQPTKSKGQSGGLRIGEMEQNALIAHGLASFTREAFMQRSDHHSTKVNATSGTPAEWWAAAREDPEGPDDEATVETPYTFTLMQHELRALGVEAALLTSTDEFHL